MSFAAVNDPASALLPPLQEIMPKTEGNESKPKYKSYKYGWSMSYTSVKTADRLRRKKFLKLKHRFERAMVDSTASYEEEQRLIKTAKRLRESNEYQGCSPFNSRR